MRYPKRSHPRHGMRDHPLYGVYKGMVERCYSPKCHNYSRYGARGISICSEWHKDCAPFFLWALDNGWKRGLQINRIDNDGDYSPGNCNFVLSVDNVRNRSTTKLTLPEAAVVKSLALLRVPQKVVGALYGVGFGDVSDIKRGRNWKDVDAYMWGEPA